MPLRVVLDTDPGIDDSLTILLALASPEVDLAAVAARHANSRRFIELDAHLDALEYDN